MRKQNLSFKDIQISYLTGGVSQVESVFNSGKTSKQTVRKALKELSTSGQDVKALEAWVLERFGSNGRGRNAPLKGETRLYKAQQVQTGGPFLRLPLEVLGVKKGEQLKVHFGGEKISVEKV